MIQQRLAVISEYPAVPRLISQTTQKFGWLKNGSIVTVANQLRAFAKMFEKQLLMLSKICALTVVCDETADPK